VTDIAVIGGGTAAACLLDSLARHPPPGAGTVTVYEPAPRLWHGQVFQDDGPEIITNVPARLMSIRADDPLHAVRWLTERGHSENETSSTSCTSGTNGTSSTKTAEWCPPRALMGQYIVDTAAAAVNALRPSGWRVRILTERAAEVAATPQGLAVTTASRCTPHDFLVLCIGHPEIPDHYGLAGHARFISNPYPTRSALAPIPTNADVAVIGTGATAVDIVAALHARSHTGRILLTSRRGRLRTVRGPTTENPRPLEFLTPERIEHLHRRGRYDLAALLALIRDELTAAGHDPTPLTHLLTPTPTNNARDPLHQLHHNLRDPIPGLDLLQRAIAVTGQTAWVHLPAQDRRQVLRHHDSVIALCFPIPHVNGRLLDALALAGQLSVLPGTRAIDKTGDLFSITTRDGTAYAPWVVNAATPAIREAPRAARPLIDSLVNQGLAVPDSFGGLSVHPGDNRLIGADQRPNERLFALGDITHGSLYITFGVPVITPIADQIAHAVHETTRQREPQ
jgi:uncharacterized NAD(P)/FAD-binding protein YdhS